MTADPGADRATRIALGLSGAGHIVHNLAEFPASVLWGPETLVPLAVTAVVGWLLLARPGRGAAAVATGWAMIVIVGGGGSVLPLGVLPFTPEQSASHYGAHVAYAALQLPLAWVGFRGLRARE
ncbi:MAG: hypothetical protein U5J98_08435 [Halobacteriales archaeon]|nr:hypothetical protein [Halobacteriales archaeon]